MPVEEVVELDEADERQSLSQPYQAKCRGKGCTMTVTVPPGAFRRELYCPKHQLVHKVTKKLVRVGYGQPKKGGNARVNRASHKGLWAAAEKVLADATRAALHRHRQAEKDAVEAKEAA